MPFGLKICQRCRPATFPLLTLKPHHMPMIQSNGNHGSVTVLQSHTQSHNIRLSVDAKSNMNMSIASSNNYSTGIGVTRNHRIRHTQNESKYCGTPTPIPTLTLSLTDMLGASRQLSCLNFKLSKKLLVTQSHFHTSATVARIPTTFTLRSAFSTTSTARQTETDNRIDADSNKDPKATANAAKPDENTNDNTKNSRWSNWTGKNSWKSGLLFLTLSFGSMAASLIYVWGEPQRDEEGVLVEDAYSSRPAVVAYSMRAWRAVLDFFQMVKDPTSEKLLPDPLAYPYVQPPYTLVLEISGLLLKPEWDMKMGWRFKKRPGLDYFLQTAAQSGYEIVIFTMEPANVAFPLTASMDTQNVIWYRLFKEDTRYTGGVHIKDLTCLNRDLSRVILLDTSKEHYKLNPRNGLALKKWTGDKDDRELYDLAAFLQTIVTNKVKDVRSVLLYYNDFDDPMQKFRENQAAVLKTQSELSKLQAEEKMKKAQGRTSPFIPQKR